MNMLLYYGGCEVVVVDLDRPDGPPPENSRSGLAPIGRLHGSVERLYCSAAAGLTPRELQLLCLIRHGLTNQQIADGLFLSINSVKSYIRTAYRRIGATRRVEAVRWAYENLTSEPPMPYAGARSARVG